MTPCQQRYEKTLRAPGRRWWIGTAPRNFNLRASRTRRMSRPESCAQERTDALEQCDFNSFPAPRSILSRTEDADSADANQGSRSPTFPQRFNRRINGRAQKEVIRR